MGGSSNRASQEAQRAEEARQAAIRNTQNRVNAVFNSAGRQADIDDAVSANRELGMRELGEQSTSANRQLRFALARNGVVGGSTQVDQQSELGRQYTSGVLDVDRRARATGADIEAADQDARARLIGLATSGLDATTAAQQAAASMRTNLAAGRAAQNASDIGNVFGGTFSDFLTQSREAAERRRANQITGFGYYPNPYG